MRTETCFSTTEILRLRTTSFLAWFGRRPPTMKTKSNLLAVVIFLGLSSVVLTAADDERPGSLDFSFDAGEILGWDTSAGPWPYVINMALSFDAKIYISGHLTSVDGVARAGLARLLPNGKLDETFSSPRRAGGEPYVVDGHDLFVQPDGRVLAGWTFISRFNQDGVMDETVVDRYVVGVVPDGKLLGLTDQNDAKLIRWLNDGTLDPTFNADGAPLLSLHNPGLPLVVQGDGKILVGSYRYTNSTFLTPVIRLNSDGSTDPTFQLAEANGFITGLVSEPIGIYVAGVFDSINGVVRHNIARLRTDGAVDLTFDAGSVVSPLRKRYGASRAPVLVQRNGKIVVVTTGTAGDRLIRLNTDGTLDASFDSGNGISESISSVLLQSDGQILICGRFTVVNGVPRRGIARLNGDSKHIRLSPPKQIGGGLMRITVGSIPGGAYTLQSSTNLFDWISLSTNIATGSTVEFEDTAATGQQRFYRARLTP